MSFSIRRVIPLLAVITFVPALHAGILAEALFSFPADTEYVEYDNLASLRTMPEYNKLRQRFAGKSLEEAASVLSQLGIPESQLLEIVNASDANASFGLISGSFSSRSFRKSAAAQRYASTLVETQMFCAGRQTCVVFLEDSLAAFGSPAQLKSILSARAGTVNRLSSKPDAIGLLNTGAEGALVRGMLVGLQVQTGVKSMLRAWDSRPIPADFLANVTGVGYSVAFDSKAHVTATVECSSTSAASLFAQAISLFAKLTTTAPFEDIEVSSAANRIYLKGAGGPQL